MDHEITIENAKTTAIMWNILFWFYLYIYHNMLLLYIITLFEIMNQMYE